MRIDSSESPRFALRIAGPSKFLRDFPWKFGSSRANFLEVCFSRILYGKFTPRQVLRGLGPFPETSPELPRSSLCFALFFGRHLVAVWIGGVWKGNFPESEKYFSEAEFSRKIPEILQKGRYSPKFQAPKFANSEPEKCNSIPPAVPYPH